MGRICSIVGCSNSTAQLNKWYSQLCDIHGLKFGSCICKPPFTLFTFPLEKKDPDARRRWIRQVNRKTKQGDNWQPTCYDRVCSLHFKDGEPSKAWPDPTENLGYKPLRLKSSKSPRAPPKERQPYAEIAKQRSRKRKRDTVYTTSRPTCTETSPIDVQSDIGSLMELNVQTEEPLAKKNVLCDHDYMLPASTDLDVQTETVLKNKLSDHDYTLPASRESCSSCHDKQERICELETKVKTLHTKLKSKKNKSKSRVSYDMTNIALKSDKTVREYTGIESKQKLDALHNYLEPRVKKMRYWTGTKKESTPRSSPRVKLDRTPQKPGPKRLLNSKQEFILVLMKLRLALTMFLLAGLFGITESTVSQIFNTWIKFLASELKPLIFWPDKMLIFTSMPQSLKHKYKHLRCTIDCTEIFIERPRDLANQAATWSDYKKHNTVKFLVAIAPNGMISFLSKAWGGRASDVHITKKSGFLNLIDPCDVVLADRGFIIKEDLLLRGARLEIPPPSKGKEQQTPGDVAKTKKVANARIHVERAIGRIKWFAILRETLPISLVPLVDDIIVVCAALVNLRPALVK